MIKPVGSMFYLYTSDGKRVLGKHKTRAEAVAQERAIKIEEAKKKKRK